MCILELQQTGRLVRDLSDWSGELHVDDLVPCLVVVGRELKHHFRMWERDVVRPVDVPSTDVIGGHSKVAMQVKMRWVDRRRKAERPDDTGRVLHVVHRKRESPRHHGHRHVRPARQDPQRTQQVITAVESSGLVRMFVDGHGDVGRGGIFPRTFPTMPVWLPDTIQGITVFVHYPFDVVGHLVFTGEVYPDRRGVGGGNTVEEELVRTIATWRRNVVVHSMRGRGCNGPRRWVGGSHLLCTPIVAFLLVTELTEVQLVDPDFIGWDHLHVQFLVGRVGVSAAAVRRIVVIIIGTDVSHLMSLAEEMNQGGRGSVQRSKLSHRRQTQVFSGQHRDGNRDDGRVLRWEFDLGTGRELASEAFEQGYCGSSVGFVYADGHGWLTLLGQLHARTRGIWARRRLH